MFERTVVGLDLGTYSVKACVLSAGLREVQFERFDELVLPAGAASEEIEATVQLWASQRNLPLGNVITALSTERTTQRHLRFPFSGAKRIAPAVVFELEEELPVPLAQVILQHESVLTRPDQTDTLALIAPREDVRNHLDSMRRMDIDPTILEVEGAVLANLTNFLELSDVCRVVLDIGHTKTHLVLLVDGKPVVLRRIAIGGQHFTNAIARDLGMALDAAQEFKHDNGLFEVGSTKPICAGVGQGLDRLARELLRSVQSVIGDPLDLIAPSQILLVGGTARVEGLAAFLEERSQLQTQSLEVTKTDGGADLFRTAGAPSFAQATALALRGAPTERVTQTNFRQGEFEHEIDLAGVSGPLRACVALFGAVLLLWMIAAGVGAYVAERRANGIGDRIAEIYRESYPGRPLNGAPLEALEAAVGEDRRMAGHLGVTGAGHDVLGLLLALAELKPENLDISIDELRIERRSIVARGHSRDFVSTDTLKQALAKYAAFEKVTISDVKTDARRGGKTFQLNVRLADT